MEGMKVCGLHSFLFGGVLGEPAGRPYRDTVLGLPYMHVRQRR